MNDSQLQFAELVNALMENGAVTDIIIEDTAYYLGVEFSDICALFDQAKQIVDSN